MHFITVHAIEPDPQRLLAVRIFIGQRSELAAVVPFLAGDRAGMAADAGVEVDDEAEFLRRRWRQHRHGISGQKCGISSIDNAQNIAISGMPTFMKSVNL